MHSLEIDRKYFFLAVNTGYVLNGLPTERCVEFYSARSGHGLYCAIVGNVVIPNGYGTNGVCAYISNSVEWRNLTNAISQRGACPGVQLSSTWPNYMGIKHFSAKQGDNPEIMYKNVLNRISVQNISEIFNNLKLGIDLAVNVGFKHIQIHAGHGYLFSLLIDEFFSKHSGLCLDHLDRIAQYIDSYNIESSLRFSLATGNKEVDKNRNTLIERIFMLPFNYFDMSSGYYNFDKRLIYPSTDKYINDRHIATLEIANSFPGNKIILSGRAHKTPKADLPRNVHIGLCRDLIANPDFLINHSMGCKNKMKCHYYSFDHSQLNCGEWE